MSDQDTSMLTRETVSSRYAARGHNRDQLVLAMLITLNAAIICFSALFIGRQARTSDRPNDVEVAALGVAEDLRLVSVESSRFGLVGLSHTTAGDREVVGINSLAATLRVNSYLARSLKFPYMQQLVEQDLKEFARCKRELVRLSQLAVQPNYFIRDEKGNGLSIFERAYRTIYRLPKPNKPALVDLKIQFGRLKGSGATSLTPAARFPLQSLPYDDGRFYLSAMPVPISPQHSFRFLELREQTGLVEQSEFTPLDLPDLASVLRLDATFETRMPSGAQKVVTKEIACAVIGSAPPDGEQQALVISFPQGRLQSLDSLSKLATPEPWHAQGEWQKADSGSVPGKGHLAPAAGTDPDETSPGSAVEKVFYHFLFSLGPKVDPITVENLVKTSWRSVVPDNDGTADYPKWTVNSALMRDTGAPFFALSYQSKPGGVGQSALQSAFAGSDRPPDFPASAFPVLVDDEGRANFGGQASMNLELVKEFMRDLHRTNLAALETHAVATAVAERMEAALAQSARKATSLKEELASLRRALGTNTKLKREREVVSSLQAERSGRARLEHILAQARTARKNAHAAALASYTIAADLAHFAGEGIKLVAGGTSRKYLLSRVDIFIPHTTPLAEEDLYDATASRKAHPSQSEAWSWLFSDFAVMDQPAPETVAGGSTLEELSTQANTHTNSPLYLLLPGSELAAGGKGLYKALSRSPYPDVPLAQNQQIFYCSDAIRTGSNPEVRWSLLVRDLQTSADGSPTGSPAPRFTGWSMIQTNSRALPALAGEIQVRLPLPIVEDFPPGLRIQHPDTQESIVLVPPVPPENL